MIRTEEILEDLLGLRDGCRQRMAEIGIAGAG